MQDEQVGQPEETVQPGAEDTAGDVSATEDTSAAVPPDPPTGEGADEAVLQAPEVPDDANDKIAAAQQHIDSLNMDRERDAAERAQKQL